MSIDVSHKFILLTTRLKFWNNGGVNGGVVLCFVLTIHRVIRFSGDSTHVTTSGQVVCRHRLAAIQLIATRNVRFSRWIVRIPLFSKPYFKILFSKWCDRTKINDLYIFIGRAIGSPQVCFDLYSFSYCNSALRWSPCSFFIIIAQSMQWAITAQMFVMTAYLTPTGKTVANGSYTSVRDEVNLNIWKINTEKISGLMNLAILFGWTVMKWFRLLNLSGISSSEWYQIC